MTGVFGEGRHGETLEDYTLTIQLLQDLSADTGRKTEEFFEMLLTVLPENIVLSVSYLFPTLSAALPVASALGPRTARPPPPPFHPRLPAGKIPAAALLGTRRSTMALPMAAAKEV